jgi:hypothetical protein
LKFISVRSRILKAINVIATIGEMGLYTEEKEDNLILLKNQPNNVIQAIKSTRKRNVSFLLIT